MIKLFLSENLVLRQRILVVSVWGALSDLMPFGSACACVQPLFMPLIRLTVSDLFSFLPNMLRFIDVREPAENYHHPVLRNSITFGAYRARN